MVKKASLKLEMRRTKKLFSHPTSPLQNQVVTINGGYRYNKLKLHNINKHKHNLYHFSIQNHKGTFMGFVILLSC